MTIRLLDDGIKSIAITAARRKGVFRALATNNIQCVKHLATIIADT
ncbi:MAG: hypothetical protein GY808_04250 [Gammaproteobacteria bacterium]|nr:hypothetical protein [Gammaproteobacteria bacterium]